MESVEFVDFGLKMGAAGLGLLGATLLGELSTLSAVTLRDELF